MKRREHSWYVEAKLFHRDGRKLWTRITRRLTFLQGVRAYRQAEQRPNVRLTNWRTEEHFFLTFDSRRQGLKPYVMHLGGI